MTQDPIISSNQRTRPHLTYLDGIRGFAALWVMGWHAIILGSHVNPWKADLPKPLAISVSFLSSIFFHYATLAVVAFIVLSGYVLSIPICTGSGVKLQGGFGRYILRRAKRILPPYYAALVFSVVVMAFTPWVHRVANWTGGENWWNNQFPVLAPGVIVSHLLLLHNRSALWFEKINGPLWSIAVEWQIYFLLPLLLLPLWRKFGLASALAFAWIVGLGSLFFAPWLLGLEGWYVGPFACGMVAAELSINHERYRWLQKMRFNFIGWLFLGLMVLCYALQGKSHGIGLIWLLDKSSYRFWLMGALFAAGFSCLLIAGTSALNQNRTTLVTRFSTLRPLVFVGGFSYSLYLIHVPIFDLAFAITASHEHWARLLPVVTFCAAPALAITCAYGFHLCFERPFMNTKPQTPWLPNVDAGAPRAD